MGEHAGSEPRSPYSRVLAGRHLSMRCRSERPAPLEALQVIVEQSGSTIGSGAGRVLRHSSYAFPVKLSRPQKRASICAKDSAPAALNLPAIRGRPARPRQGREVFVRHWYRRFHPRLLKELPSRGTGYLHNAPALHSLSQPLPARLRHDQCFEWDLFQNDPSIRPEQACNLHAGSGECR